MLVKVHLIMKRYREKGRTEREKVLDLLFSGEEHIRLKRKEQNSYNRPDGVVVRASARIG